MQSVFQLIRLVGGTTGAHVITMAGTLWIARLYLPEQFGYYATVMAVSGVLGVLIAFRYEMTIVLIKTDHQAKQALSLSFLVSSAIGILLMLISGILLLFKVENDLLRASPMIALISWMFIIEQIFFYWFNRQQQYGTLSWLAAFRSLAIVSMQVMLIRFENGLLLGHVIGHGLFTVVLLFVVRHVIWSSLRGCQWKRLRCIAIRYFRFPQYSLPAAFLSGFGRKLPVILINEWWGADKAGYFSMITRVMLVPSILISANINRIVLQRLAYAIARNEPTRKIVLGATSGSTIISILMVLAVFIFARYELFGMLLSERWKVLDRYALLVLPYAAVFFVAKSVSRFEVYGRNDVGLLFQILFFLSSALPIFIVYKLELSFENMLMVFSCAMAMLGMLQIVITLCLSKKNGC